MSSTWTVVPGVITLADGRKRAAWRTDYASGRPSEYTVSIPVRGATVHKTATKSQAATFITQAEAEAIVRAKN